VDARAKIEDIKVRQEANLEELVAIRERNEWVRVANEEDDAASEELPIAEEKRGTLVIKQEWTATKKYNFENRQARIRGIRLRLRNVRDQIEKWRLRRVVWWTRTENARRYLIIIRKKITIFRLKLKKLRLLRKKATEAVTVAVENEDTIDEETIDALKIVEKEAIEAVEVAEKEELVLIAEEEAQVALVEQYEQEEEAEIAEIDRIEYEDGLIEE